MDATRSGRLLVLYDPDCGVCSRLAAWLHAEDTGRRLLLVRNDGRELPFGVPRALVEETVVVIDPASGRRWTHGEAVRRILLAIPRLRPAGWLAALPLAGLAVDRAYRAFSARRHLVSQLLGLNVCALPQRAT